MWNVVRSKSIYLAYDGGWKLLVISNQYKLLEVSITRDDGSLGLHKLRRLINDSALKRYILHLLPAS